MFNLRSIAIALIVAAGLHAQVRVWEGTMTLPTSEEGPPDANPPFDSFATTRFNYPYTLRENLTGKNIDVSWRAVYFENEFLKCSVLPDLGGHLYTCIDKLTNEPMFYANPSIKKANIGYRGAWAAFGIEFNFPVSHNWVSMSPVPLAFAKHEDGSASVTVGNTDRVYGMEWTVELALRPGSTVLEQRVTLYNRSDVRHRFYWWTNAGVRVWDDSRIHYPMRFSASHGFKDVARWPVDSTGADLSLIANQKYGPVSRFVHGSREPFMGVYHPHSKTGVVHYADYADLPGKKIWSWGVDPDGLDWRRALSDDNSAYVEVQAGLFRDQETYSFLEPRQTIRFTEYWMPVRAIGGIARANLHGVLNLDRLGGKVTAALNVNRRIPQARLRLLDGDAVLFEQTMDLSPERTWTHEAILDRKCTFELLDEHGASLMKHTEGVYDWTPEKEIKLGPQTPPRSDGDFLAIGTDQELNGLLLAAYDTYQQGLRAAPNSLALRVASGRLAAALLRYDDAVRDLEAAQARATHDPEIAYYLGLAYDGLGDVEKARTAFEIAQRAPEFHAAGCLRLGELAARSGDLAEARRYLTEAVRSGPNDARAAEELVAIERKGDAEWARRFPTSVFLTRQINSDPDRVLDIAGTYMRLGLWREALDVLSAKYPAVPAEQLEPRTPLPQDHMLVAYYRAFCREKLGEAAAADYKLASAMPAQYIFPSGAMTFKVVTAALRENHNDATARFLFGALLLASGRVELAITEWQTARRFNPRIPVLAASLGRTLLDLRHDPAAAMEVFREGMASDPENLQIYSGMIQALRALKRPATERIATLEKYPDPSRMPAPLVYELARNYAEAGQFDKADALFRNRFFPREEGGTNVRQVWVEVRLARALSAAERGACDEALAVTSGITRPVEGLAFTRDGLERFLKSARSQSQVATINKRCGR